MDEKVIEDFHKVMKKQFLEMYISQQPTLRELQAQQRQEAIERIKNILFAQLLMRLIKNYSIAGNSESLEIDLQSLAEALW